MYIFIYIYIYIHKDIWICIYILCALTVLWGIQGFPAAANPLGTLLPFFLILSPSLLSSAPPVLRHRFLASTTTNSTTPVLVVNFAVSSARGSSRATFILGRRC